MNTIGKSIVHVLIPTGTIPELRDRKLQYYGVVRFGFEELIILKTNNSNFPEQIKNDLEQFYPFLNIKLISCEDDYYSIFLKIVELIQQFDNFSFLVNVTTTKTECSIAIRDAFSFFQKDVSIYRINFTYKTVGLGKHVEISRDNPFTYIPVMSTRFGTRINLNRVLCIIHLLYELKEVKSISQLTKELEHARQLDKSYDWGGRVSIKVVSNYIRKLEKWGVVTKEVGAHNRQKIALKYPDSTL